VILSPSLLRIILIEPVVQIRAKFPLSPLIPSCLLATGLRAVSLMGYIAAGSKRISTVLASPFHFALPNQQFFREA
jgi:hypothetical protein